MIGGRDIYRPLIILARSGGLAAAATRSAHGHAVSRGRRTAASGAEGKAHGAAQRVSRGRRTRGVGGLGGNPRAGQGLALAGPGQRPGRSLRDAKYNLLYLS